MYRRIFHKALIPTALALLITACGMDTEQTPRCDYASGNLLADPGFATMDAPQRERAWRYSQHAGDTSFRYSANQGTLTFEKTGSEPWGILTQGVDIKGLKGKRVEFSAELKLDLTEPKHSHGFDYGGGLTLLAKQGNKIKMSSSLDHEPRMGTHDWQRVSVIVDLPKAMSYLRAGFLHQAGGKMQVRDPALRKVAGTCVSP